MSSFVVDYGPDVESAIDRLVGQIERSPKISASYSPRWLATALLDEDPGLAFLQAFTDHLVADGRDRPILTGL